MPSAQTTSTRFALPEDGERVGEIEGVEEARAGCVYVQRRAVRADLRLQKAAEGGGDGVRQDAGCKDIVDVRGGEAGVFQRGVGGAGGELQKRLVGDDLPGADAGVGADPLVRGIEELAQIIIGERVRGQGAAGPQYPHAFSLLAPSYSSTFWRMNSLMRWSALEQRFALGGLQAARYGAHHLPVEVAVGRLGAAAFFRKTHAHAAAVLVGAILGKIALLFPAV